MKPVETSIFVDLTQENSTSQILPSPILSSYKAGWSGISLEYFRHSAHETPEHYCVQHSIGIQTGVISSVFSERRLNRRFQKEKILDGDICIVPAYTDHWTYSCTEDHTEESYILLNLEPRVLAQSIYEYCDPDDIELVPQFAKSDQLIYQIGLALKTELVTNGSGGCLYAEAMATALSLHLLRHYTTRNPFFRDDADGLPKRHLRQIIDYINTHLNQELSLTELAKLAHMSSCYLVRQFKKSTGLTPYQYIIKQRLERAKQLLSCTDLSITQVAYNVGFSSQSQFSTMFRQHLNTSPKMYRKQTQ